MFQSYRNSQLICSPNQLTGFYMMGALVVNVLNKPGAIEIAKNFWRFLLKQDWCSADITGNISLGGEKDPTASE